MGLSCRQLSIFPFEAQHRAIYPRHFRLQRCMHSRRFALAERNTPHMRASIVLELKVPCDPAIQTGEHLESIKVGRNHLPFSSHNVAFDSPKNYSSMNFCQGENVAREKPKETMELKDRIKEVRHKVLRLTQAQLSNRLGISQSNVAKWETGQLKPEAQHLMRLAALLGDKIESFYFLEEAGVPSSFFMGSPKYSESILPTEFWLNAKGGASSGVYQVPLLRDPAAAGTTRAIDEGAIEAFIPSLKSWSPRGSALTAFRVTGDSMAPLIRDGYIVVIDTSQRDPKKLVGKMVAARDRDGMTLKWLRKDRDSYILVPEHTSQRFPVSILREEDGWEIVGAVIHWIGFPPGGKKGMVI